jgi:NitT/TauT family transport system permease protein
MKIADFFELRGTLPKRPATIIAIGGFFFFILLWQSMSWFKWVPESLLPSPIAVLSSYKELHFERELVRNCIYSIKLNLLGYLEAVVIAIPLGFIMGLFPFFKVATDKYIKALRFIPLAAATGLFISWFHIGDNMKIQFLAASIIVYLIPVIIQRIEDVTDVYVHTAYTLGANKIQTITSVFIPAIRSVIVDDIRILVAISWTYITIAEALNMTKGIGMLAVQCGRQSRVDMVFAILFLIALIGFCQDILFKKLDKSINRHKYI